MIALLSTLWLAAQCQGPACPTPCDACTYPAVFGENPSVVEFRQIFDDIAVRAGADDLPVIDDIEVGADRVRTAVPFPCRLLKAIGMTESGVEQFCPESNLTVISFDCGFGVMQVTSDAQNYPGIEARVDINIAAGADILAQKWNSETVFGGVVGDSDPAFVESWYYAVWAYNGFVYRNNPNNPDFPSERPPYNGAASLPRVDYPYQEIVWGYLRNPNDVDGEEFYVPLEVSYPANADIPNQEGLFSVPLALPEPTHTDACTETCPEAGCPPQADRVFYLDDADASFTLEGTAELHTDGGFRNQFRTAPLVAGEPTVVARFSGAAPASGVFDVAMFIPLDPATAEEVHVTVTARGGTTTFAQNQNQAGGRFETLARVELLAGEPVRIEVTNSSTDDNPDHRMGVDAFRLTWRSDGTSGQGESCALTTACAGALVCVEGTCVEGCEVTGCDADTCVPETGLCGEAGLPPSASSPSSSSSVSGCSCDHGAPHEVAGVLGLLLTLRYSTRRRTRSSSANQDRVDRDPVKHFSAGLTPPLVISCRG